MNAFSKPLLLLVMAMLASSGLASPAPPTDTSKVYGAPSNGRIRVETTGGPDRWEHPGMYWLPKGTTLLDFVKMSGPKDILGDGTDHPFIDVTQGGRHRGSFYLPRIRPGTPKGTFQLQDGDVLATVAAMT